MRWQGFSPHSIVLSLEHEIEQILMNLTKLFGRHAGNLRHVFGKAQATFFEQIV
jgi:hypothetical protein